MSDDKTLLNDLLNFLRDSPTPFHAVANLVALLQQNNFQIIRESDAWNLQPGGRYIVTRNDSSLLAFVLGSDDVVDTGIHLAGAHTDSPCLKIKPNPELQRQGYFQLGVEVYGGVLLAPWFDRDLSLAGRVSYLDQQGKLASALIDFKKPIAIIPSLAIHLDRDVNSNRSINAQTQLPPVLVTADNNQADFRALLKEQLRKQQGIDTRDVLDYEVSCYDTQPPALVGLSEEFIASARIDNLLSCFVAIQALVSANGKRTAMVMCSDHEEVGSASVAGAQGTLLQAVLRRIAGSSDERYARMIDKSLLISCDNAHGIHPNFADKHDANHGPLINKGPVIKINANQRYATNSETAAYFRQLCAQVAAPVQSFVVRSDMACGSTIGPIVATETGINTVDVGVPQWAMHSIRETAGTRDCEYLYRVLQQFFRE
ncbi:MAG: M18 family aminopeptidase [Spongiibacteraceae bacterium]